MPQVTKQNLF